MAGKHEAVGLTVPIEVLPHVINIIRAGMLSHQKWADNRVPGGVYKELERWCKEGEEYIKDMKDKEMEKDD